MLESEYRLCRISIHAPPRGATHGAVECPRRDVFQFTPLREGRLHGAVECPRRDVFQFTPLREGRRHRCRSLCREAYFNSRPSARGDKLSELNCLPTRSISIHAPPRGATLLLVNRVFLLSDFNSRPSARGDAKRRSASSSATSFQFTPLREGRLCGTSSVRAVIHFNSRPSARGDFVGRQAFER